MMNRRIIIVLLIALFASIGAKAQDKWYQTLGTWVQGKGWQMEEQLPTTHTKYLVQYGERSIIDEFLSPIAHRGWDAKISYLTDYNAPAGRAWHLYQELSIFGGIMKNPANSAQMYGIGLEYDLGPSWRILRHKGLSLDLAPLFALKAEGNFKLSNTNNIANAKGSFGIDGWARLRYQIPWKVMPLAISYSAQIPLLQCAFHPDYGQSYYDYISGENGAKFGFRFGAPHNTAGIQQRLLIDLPIHNFTLTLGAEHTYLSQKLNNTSFREGSWGIVIGFSMDQIGFSGNKSLKSSQLHSTLYR